jgi:glutamate-1-semialdehyde aminotransferase
MQSGYSAMITAGNLLLETIKSVESYLQVREQRKALEAKLDYEREVIRKQVRDIEMKVKMNIRFWESQIKSNKDAREKISEKASELIGYANLAIELASRLSDTDKDKSSKLIDSANNAIMQAANLIREKFPTDPLASID